jgi:cell division protein FtsZ
VELLRDQVDTLIVIPNDRLLDITDRQLSVLGAFAAADQVLQGGVQGITDLITTPGLINVDFNDVRSVMQGAGTALMGVSSARGEDRAIKAAESAISSPLLEASIEGAHGVLLSIAGGSNLGIKEVETAAKLVREAAHAEANIIFGTVIDDALGDEIRITVIAAGFDGGAPPVRRHPGALGQVDGAQPKEARTKEPVDALLEVPSRARSSKSEASKSEPVLDETEALKVPGGLFESDDLDIPDFLKR